MYATSMRAVQGRRFTQLAERQKSTYTDPYLKGVWCVESGGGLPREAEALAVACEEVGRQLQRLGMGGGG